MRPGRMQYRGSVTSESPGTAIDASTGPGLGMVGTGGSATGRPGLTLLALLILGMAAFAYWTR